MESIKFVSPKKIVVERGSVLKTGTMMKSVGSNALICIGGNSFKNSGGILKLTSSLDRLGLKYTVYDSILPDPDVSCVEKGAEICIENGCDCIISAGGGSVIDAGKAIGLLVVNGGKIQDYVKTMPSKRMLPMIAIPTTAGTASEVTKYSIITDKEQKKKLVIAGEEIVPDIALLDVDLTLTMPPKIAAATGMDALTHAIESYISDNANMLTRKFSMEATKLILDNLASAVYNLNDIKAHENMLYAQMLAGLAFSATTTCLVHSMSRPLGACYGIPHGEANAVLLPDVLRYNLIACVSKLAQIARECRIGVAVEDDYAYANALIDRIDQLKAELPIRTRLSRMGVEEKDFDFMADDALSASSTAVNPRKPLREDIIGIYKKLM